jgi:hypothetical protein
MKQALTPLTVAVVLFTMYSLNWLKSEQPRKSSSHLSAQEISNTEAALRHKHCLPSHWRPVVMYQR